MVVDRIRSTGQVSQHCLELFKAASASGELAHQAEDSRQAIGQVRLEDVLHQQERGLQRDGPSDLSVRVRREIADVVAELGEVRRERRGQILDQGLEALRDAPPAAAVVENYRENRE